MTRPLTIGSTRIGAALVAAATAAVLAVGAGPAGAASPSSGAVGPANRSLGWSGNRYVLGVTPAAAACVAGVTCDVFGLSIGAGSAYWASHDGSMTVSIRWGSASDDFDLYLYRGGTLVASSAAGGTRTERVVVGEPVGTYEVRVVPKNVTDSAYGGRAAFSSQADPSSGGGSTGGGGGGSGGGAGGGDSGSGSGGGGSGGGSGSEGSGSGGGSGSGSTGGLPSSWFDAPIPSFAGSSFDTRLVYQDVRSHEHGRAGRDHVAPSDAGTDVRLVNPSRAEDEGTRSATSAGPSGESSGALPLTVWVLAGIAGLLLVAFGVAVFEPAEVRPASHPGTRAPRPPPGVVRSAAALVAKLFRER